MDTDDDENSVGSVEESVVLKELQKIMSSPSADCDPPIANLEPMPEASPPHLATITMTGYIPAMFNLEIVTRNIELDEIIRGIRCDGVGNRGIAPAKKSKIKKIQTEGVQKKQNKNRNKKDFFNQCTLIVAPDASSATEINAKLFNNGQMVFVGIKNEQDAIDVIGRIVDALICMEPGHVTYTICDKIVDEFDMRDFENLLKKNSQYLDVLSAYLNTRVTLFPNLSIKYAKITDLYTQFIKLRRHKKREKWNSHTDTYEKNKSLHITALLNPAEESELMLLIKLFQIFTMYVTPDEMKELLDTTVASHKSDTLNHFLQDIVAPILTNLCLETRTIGLYLPPYLKLTHSSLDYDHNSMRIGMINTYFYVNYRVNRPKIQQILVDKYNLSAAFEPDGYPAVNAKYISKADCSVQDHTVCQCKKKSHCNCACKCQEISIFMFIKGTIIITGAKSWRQVEDTYNFMIQVMKNEYGAIRLKEPPKPLFQKRNNKPSMIRIGDELWIKKDFIRKDFKNYYIIRESKIDHLL